jgi:RNA polymerase sigma-70 factor (ECF subfamily)
MVLAHHGRTCTEDEVRQLLGTNPHGTRARDILRVATLGFDVHIEKSTPVQLATALTGGVPLDFLTRITRAGSRSVSGMVGRELMTIHTLLARVKAGDREAWGPLYELVQPHLLRLAQQRLGPTWPQESVSDLVQSTWERALRQLDQFQGGADDAQTAPMFRAWLSQILRNVHRNDLRDRQAARRHPPGGVLPLSTAAETESADGPEVDVAASDPTASRVARLNELRAALQDAMQTLDEMDRRIVLLHFFDGLSLREIARRMNLEQNTVFDRFRRLKKRLQRELGEFDDDAQ